MSQPTCSIDGCDKHVKPRHSKCSMHVARIARHGSPDVVVAPADRAHPRGSDSATWNAQGSYSAVHQRLRRVRGLARTHACVDCGSRAFQWSYDRVCPSEQVSAEGPYTTDLSHYVARCVSCHKRFDLAHQ